MGIIEAVIIGIIEGITEFLPVSSTAHVTIVEKLFGHSIENPGIVAFTAIIQVGAIAAALLYFRNDILRLIRGWFKGLLAPDKRSRDYRFGWAIIIGSIPIGIIGLLFKDQIEHGLRNLWLVAAALLIWSGVMWLADRIDAQNRHEKDVTWRDTLFIGVVQCLALVPGVSRSGATISAGLFRGLDRVAVTRLSFFLAIPALTAAGLLETVSRWNDVSQGVGWTATIIATLASFVTAYASIAWLLNFVAKHNFNVFVIYRIVVAFLLMGALATGLVAAT